MKWFRGDLIFLLVNENLIIIFFIVLIMKCIFKKLKNLHYLHLMIKGVLKVILKVNLGTEHYHFEYVIVIQILFSKMLSFQDLLFDILYFSIARMFNELFLKEQFNSHLFELEIFKNYNGQASTFTRTIVRRFVRGGGGNNYLKIL